MFPEIVTFLQIPSWPPRPDALFWSALTLVVGGLLGEFVQRALGMPRTLREVKIAEADLPRLAQNCMLDDWTYSNPRPISRPEQVMEILKAAY